MRAIYCPRPLGWVGLDYGVYTESAKDEEKLYTVKSVSELIVWIRITFFLFLFTFYESNYLNYFVVVIVIVIVVILINYSAFSATLRLTYFNFFLPPPSPHKMLCSVPVCVYFFFKENIYVGGLYWSIHADFQDDVVTQITVLSVYFVHTLSVCTPTRSRMIVSLLSRHKH